MLVEQQAARSAAEGRVEADCLLGVLVRRSAEEEKLAQHLWQLQQEKVGEPLSSMYSIAYCMPTKVRCCAAVMFGMCISLARCMRCIGTESHNPLCGRLVLQCIFLDIHTYIHTHACGHLIHHT